MRNLQFYVSGKRPMSKSLSTSLLIKGAPDDFLYWLPISEFTIVTWKEINEQLNRRSNSARMDMCMYRKMSSSVFLLWSDRQKRRSDDWQIPGEHRIKIEINKKKCLSFLSAMRLKNFTASNITLSSWENGGHFDNHNQHYPLLVFHRHHDYGHRHHH